MTAPTQEAIARAIDPDSWRLRDSDQYAHLPNEARDAVVRRSMEQAGRVCALLSPDPLRSGIEALADEWGKLAEQTEVAAFEGAASAESAMLDRSAMLDDHAAALRALLSGAGA